jgi:hypothetical protein
MLKNSSIGFDVSALDDVAPDALLIFDEGSKFGRGPAASNRIVSGKALRHSA